MQSKSSNRAARGSVRIIGGRWKRSVLSFAASEGLRPTPDRVRETLFNWLGQDLAGARVLDAFAGTGVLGLEAASRDAALVVALEMNPKTKEAIAAHAQRLGATQFEIVCVNALAWLAHAAKGAQRFDVIFLDPPFQKNFLAQCAEFAPQVLAQGGVIYVESPTELTEFGALARIRHARAGAVHYHLFHHDD